ncbi:MAG: MFS transporter [Alphaproteobacteria bacterium]
MQPSSGLRCFGKCMELDALDIDLKHLKYGLFAKRRFLPIFLATFLGAFNDNLLRSGLVVLIAYSASKGITLPAQPEILVTLCSALLVLPILLFSSIAGPLADKYEKSQLVILTKIAELGIMLCVFYGFATLNIYLLMVMLFVSGTHTTFYSPIKFSILPDHLSNKELLAANGFMAAGSYLAILGGLIAGGLLVEMEGNVIGGVAICIAAIGLLASLFIPKSRIANPHIEISLNIWKGTQAMIRNATYDMQNFRAILGLSWFLLVGSVYMSQFANYAQAVVRANNEVYVLFLLVFSVGIAFGSMICDTLLKGEISTKLTPLMAFGTALFTLLMVLATPVPVHEGLMGVSEFLSTTSHWPVLGCMLMVAVCGGIYIVPLYAFLQSQSHEKFRSRIMAASNMCDSVFMTLAAIASAILLMLGFNILDLFLVLATLNLVVVWYAWKFTREV